MGQDHRREGDHSAQFEDDLSEVEQFQDETRHDPPQFGDSPGVPRQPS
jgi:hypothetical protein